MLRKQYDVLLLQHVYWRGCLWFPQWQSRCCLQAVQSLSESGCLMGFSPPVGNVNAGGNNSTATEIRIDFPDVYGAERKSHCRKYKFEKEAA